MAGASLFQVGENVEFWRVLVQLSILAFCLVLLETALHRLEHKFPPSEKFQHMLKKAYRELMVLGLISLGLKILKENPGIDSYSKTIIAFQVADLIIFFLALVLILQSTGVFLLLRNQNERAERAELISTHDLADSVNARKKADGAFPSFVHTLFCCSRTAKKTVNDMQLVELRLLRRLFLRRFGLPQLFPFSKYLSRAQETQISYMIEVEPSMWVVLLIVAWSIGGLLEVFKALDGDMPESHELVEAFMIVAWMLLLLHIMVFLYFRSCVQELLHAAAYSNNKATLASNLSAIADEEAIAWQKEEADKAHEVMCSIQEHHEELEYQRLRKRQSTFQRFVNYFKDDKEKERDSLSGVVAGSPTLNLRSFSHRGWHVGVMLLLILNGFLVTLFMQCALYDLDDIYEEYGTLPAVMVPLPLVLNIAFFQRHIFYNFVVVSNMLRIDSHTLSDVVENFSEVVHLRSEFATTLLQNLTQHELTIEDLQTELKARDTTGTGFIEVDDLRDVLSKFGFRLTRFRFNSVVKLLFELHDTTVAYAHVVRLVFMAQNENLLGETVAIRQQPHPLLRPSVMMYDDLGQSSMRSQSNYNIFNSTRQVPVMAPPTMEDEPSADDFVTIGMGSSILPLISQRSINPAASQTNMMRPSMSSHAVHGLSCVGAQPAGSRYEPAADDVYTIVSRIDEDESVVAVVRRNGVLHLLYDETIIGAEFDDPYLRKQTAFPGFTIMQCAAYLRDKPTRAVQIGLGIGSVPTFLREMDIPTDVVEISDAVVTQAADYFQFERCPHPKEDDEDFEGEENCPSGRTFVMDGLKFLASKPTDLGIQTEEEQGQKHPYDLFIVDVYTGWNPFAFFVREKMMHVRDNWLTDDGVLVMNFVGYMQDPRAVAPKSIYRTLQSVFKYVKCFREMEEDDEEDAANIVFYASDKTFSFNLPTTREYRNPPAHTYFSVVKNFPNWEIFTELQADVEMAIHQDMTDEEVRFVSSSDDTSKDDDAILPRVLTEADHGEEEFREIHAETQAHMRERVLEQFPPALWTEFKQKPSTTPPTNP